MIYMIENHAEKKHECLDEFCGASEKNAKADWKGSKLLGADLILLL